MFQCLRNNNMGVVPVMETVVSLPKFAFDATALRSVHRKAWYVYTSLTTAAIIIHVV